MPILQIALKDNDQTVAVDPRMPSQRVYLAAATVEASDCFAAEYSALWINCPDLLKAGESEYYSTGNDNLSTLIPDATRRGFFIPIESRRRQSVQLNMCFKNVVADDYNFVIYKRSLHDGQ
jgi:hypothetical protein